MPKKWKGTELTSSMIDDAIAKAKIATETMHQIKCHGLYSKNIFQKMNKMMQCFEYMEFFVEVLQEMFKMTERENAAYRDKLPQLWANNYEWTENDDMWLVEQRAEGALVDTIALQMGRSSSSISSRLSYLVGVKRPKHIQGIIEGYLNDEAVRGYFVGDVK